jgi:CubicO group peptidase (beta-lactamase class C family)
MLERVNPSRIGLSEDRLERVSEWLEQQIESQRLAGASVLIARHGDVGYFRAAGFADVEQSKPFNEDTLVRIFSMTKPITSVAAMMLYEQGRFQLDDPVAKYLPEFAQTQVWKGGNHPLEAVEPQQNPMLIKHLFTHTSGLTYGFMNTNVVDAQYRAQGLEFPGKPDDLAQWVEQLAYGTVDVSARQSVELQCGNRCIGPAGRSYGPVKASRSFSKTVYSHRWVCMTAALPLQRKTSSASQRCIRRSVGVT